MNTPQAQLTVTVGLGLDGETFWIALEPKERVADAEELLIRATMHLIKMRQRQESYIEEHRN